MNILVMVDLEDEFFCEFVFYEGLCEFLVCDVLVCEEVWKVELSFVLVVSFVVFDWKVIVFFIFLEDDDDMMLFMDGGIVFCVVCMVLIVCVFVVVVVFVWIEFELLVVFDVEFEVEMRIVVLGLDEVFV